VSLAGRFAKPSQEQSPALAPIGVDALVTLLWVVECPIASLPTIPIKARQSRARTS
jgi:hypothetical protein